MDVSKTPVLSVRNVYKRFGKNTTSSRNILKSKLHDAILNKSKENRILKNNEFLALKNVSFDLFKGEALGIIGLNGSGKSTLLKIINGLSLPDYGTVDVRGEVGGLIELGAGFKDELSGNENIYIKGALLGKSKAEVDAIYNDIVNFAELKDFINTPIKNYSSGMRARLGFAVSIHIQPDILLMDEVLAVGDFTFQQKCLAKVNEMRHSMTVLFVSHSMNSVKMFCDKALVLNNGHIEIIGTPDECFDHYHKIQQPSKPRQNEIKQFLNNKQIKSYMGDFIINRDRINTVVAKWSSPSVKINEEFKLSINLDFINDVSNLIIGVPIWDANGVFVTALNSDNFDLQFKKDKKTIKIEISLPCYLNPGVYDAVLAVVDNGEYLYRQPIESLLVEPQVRRYGLYSQPSSWEVHYD